MPDAGHQARSDARPARVILTIDIVHGFVVLHVAQIDEATDDVLEFQPCLIEDLDMPFRHLADLVADTGRRRTLSGRGAGKSGEVERVAGPDRGAGCYAPIKRTGLDTRGADNLAGRQVGGGDARNLDV